MFHYIFFLQSFIIIHWIYVPKKSRKSSKFEKVIFSTNFEEKQKLKFVNWYVSTIWFHIQYFSGNFIESLIELH